MPVLRWFAPADCCPAVRLLCFPHAGGGATRFRNWRQWLGPNVAIGAYQAPGHEERFGEPPFRSVSQMALDALTGISSLPFSRWILLGHSLGASVAFEVARALENSGGHLLGLIVLARQAPHCKPRRKRISGLPDGEFLRELRKLGGLPDSLLASRDLVQLLMPLLRAEIEAAESYWRASGLKLQCPVAAVAAAQDGSVDLDDLRAWNKHAAGTFEIHTVPGNHFAAFDAPVFASLLIDSISRFSHHPVDGPK